MKRSWFKLSLLGKLIFFVNFFFVFLLIISYLASFTGPDTLWPLAFAGLVYPILLGINIVIVLGWLIFRKIHFLVSLLTILAGFSHVQNFFQWNELNRELPSGGTNIHLLSYNVRVFDLYSYGPSWEIDFTNRNNIFRYLQAKDYDILCFQEFVHDRSGEFKTLDTLPHILRARHHHFEYTRSSRNKNFFGLATFSAYPIVNKGKILLETRYGNLCIYSDIAIGKDTLRVYNVHLESIGLSEEDFLFLENMSNIIQAPEKNALTEGGRRILGQLKTAFLLRAPQARKIAEHMETSPYPVILAGDFNDTPASYVYRALSKNLHDAFRSGRGIGQTYIGAIPGFRIDYILHSEEFTAYNFQTGTREYSDHYPISTVLNFQTKE